MMQLGLIRSFSQDKSLTDRFRGNWGGWEVLVFSGLVGVIDASLELGLKVFIAWSCDI